MSKAKSSVVIIFVEGYTEVEFYKSLVRTIRSINGDTLPCLVETKNLKGIGNYKKDILASFKKLKKKHPDCKYHIFLCYDTDAFEFQRKPPVDWRKIKQDLEKEHADTIHLVPAEKSIEDWFLIDTEGVLKYLKLPSSTKMPKGTGQKVIKSLFKKSNKIYVKGKAADLIEYLDIKKILVNIYSNIKNLCTSLGLESIDSINPRSTRKNSSSKMK